jgi:acetyl esterase/lipase
MQTLDIDIKDVTYRDIAPEPLVARLYRPLGDGPFPAVVSLHGGRWVAETRLTNEVLDRALAAAGIVVMAIDVRMPPAFRYPEPVADVNFAIRWLKQHAAEFKTRPALVGAVGTSSGGHQTMLNALQPANKDYAAIPLAGSDATADLAYIVACWPVLDPLRRYRMAKEKGMEIHVKAHDAYWPDEASMGVGNPQAILERGEYQALPPALLIQGTADTIVPPDMTYRFAESYAVRGGAARVEKFEGEAHTFITKLPGSDSSNRAIEVIKQFILQQAAAIRT